MARRRLRPALVDAPVATSRSPGSGARTIRWANFLCEVELSDFLRLFGLPTASTLEVDAEDVTKEIVSCETGTSPELAIGVDNVQQQPPPEGARPTLLQACAHSPLLSRLVLGRRVRRVGDTDSFEVLEEDVAIITNIPGGERSKRKLKAKIWAVVQNE